MQAPRQAARRVIRWVAGFTLVELMITLSVMVVLGSLAMPSLSALVSHQRLKAAAYHLQADIALAKHESGRRGQPVHLRFVPGAAWCYLLSTGVAADCHQSLPSDMSGVIKVVRAVDHPGVALLEAQPMVIDALAAAALPLQAGPAGRGRAQARFGSPDGSQLQVRLGPQSRATVCAVGAALGGLATCPVAVGDAASP